MQTTRADRLAAMRTATRTPDLPTRTATAEATAETEAGGTATPWPAVLTLEEAVATVEAWFELPELEGRVDRAYFATHAELAHQLVEAGYPRLSTASGREFDTSWANEQVFDDDLLDPGLLAIVEASHRAAHNSCRAPSPRGEPQPCGAWLGEERHHLIALVDADGMDPRFADFHGRPYTIQMSLLPLDISSGVDQRWPDEVSLALLEAEPWVRRAPRRETPGDGPTPTATVRPPLTGGSNGAVPMSVGEAPAAIMPLAEDWPLVEGARWTYRELDLRRGAVKASGLREIRVEQAIRTEPAAMVARFSQDQGYPLYRPDMRLSPHGLDTCLDVPSNELGKEMENLGRQDAQSRCELKSDRVPLQLLESLADAGQPMCEMRALVVFCRDQSVDTPAGRFEGCYSVQDEGMLVEVLWWYCPGVGLVRHQVRGRGVHTVWDLVDYEIPPLVPVP